MLSVKMEGIDERIVALYPWIKDRARYYFRNKEDAEDLASETVYRLLENRDKYNSDYDLKPWCSVVMKNLYSNYYRRRQIVNFVMMEDYHTPFVGDVTNYKDLLGIMRHLSQSSTNVHCVDLYVRGFSYEEISRMLNIKIGTVRSRIFNGRKTLRMAFEG